MWNEFSTHLIPKQRPKHNTTFKIFDFKNLIMHLVVREIKNPIIMLKIMDNGIVKSSDKTEVFSPPIFEKYNDINVVKNVIATVSSADAPTRSIFGIAFFSPIFLSIKSTIDGIKTAGLTAAIINPRIPPWINENFKNTIDKIAMVNPSIIAGITLNKIAGLPIFFISLRLIPSPQ